MPRALWHGSLSPHSYLALLVKSPMLVELSWEPNFSYEFPQHVSRLLVAFGARFRAIFVILLFEYGYTHSYCALHRTYNKSLFHICTSYGRTQAFFRPRNCSEDTVWICFPLHKREIAHHSRRALQHFDTLHNSIHHDTQHDKPSNNALNKWGISTNH